MKWKEPADASLRAVKSPSYMDLQVHGPVEARIDKTAVPAAVAAEQPRKVIFRSIKKGEQTSPDYRKVFPVEAEAPDYQKIYPAEPGVPDYQAEVLRAAPVYGLEGCQDIEISEETLTPMNDNMTLGQLFQVKDDGLE